MRIEEHIGHQIHQVRESRGLTLADLGKSLEPWTGREWSAQAVWQAENGKRDFKASHLLAFALALDVPLAYLIAPPTEGVEIGDGAMLDVDQVDRLFSVSVAVPKQHDLIVDVLYRAEHIVRELMELRKHERIVTTAAEQLHSIAIELLTRPQTLDSEQHENEEG